MKKSATLALLLVLAGCSSAKEDTASPAPGLDSGIAQCQKLAKTAADPDSDEGVPTDEDFERVQKAYEDSEFSDLKRAGLSHLAAVKDYYDHSDDVDIQDVMIKRGGLEATCKVHGVPIVHVAPSYSPEPMPTLPDLPMPTNPYAN